MPSRFSANFSDPHLDLDSLTDEVFRSAAEITRIAREDLDQLRLAGVKAILGDIRCIGHMTHMAVWNLRASWDATEPTFAKLEQFGSALAALGLCETLIEAIAGEGRIASVVHNLPLLASDERDAVAF